jgi:hypothetical protein
MGMKTEDNVARYWAPKVSGSKIRQLYLSDARGFVDEDLVNEVGYTLYARCQTIWIVTERRCPECTARLVRKGENVTCPGCGWVSLWRSYHRSYKGKRIHGGRAYPAFLQFMKEFRRASGPREKLLAIDKVVHAVHEALDKVWTVPASVNLIEGKRDEVIALLDDLAHGDAHTPGIRDAWVEYRQKMEESRGPTDAHIRKVRGREGRGDGG